MNRLHEALDDIVVQDWRGILRPIRDGLDNIRDRLPGAGSETPKERQQKSSRRRADILRGFAYFDSFQELQAWTVEQVDPMQRSSFPIITRPDNVSRRTPRESKRASIMICHDYAGGYHPYESISRNTVGNKQFVLEYLSYVQVFIYFSHRLVTIPPPTWTNVLHKNGVWSLGTFIVEHRISGRDSILHFEETENGPVYPVAKILADMAIGYGFDGWLINIESAFTSTSWNLEAMNGFLQQLRSLMGPLRRVIWYDALTVDGKIQHQNALNYANHTFFKACNDILINYKWDLDHLYRSLENLGENASNNARIHFGIDIWAQNRPQDLLHPRVTYPSANGGGTNTGLAVHQCALAGTSACIFGPAWSYEHFKSPEAAAAAVRTMWEGTTLPEQLPCHCYPDHSEKKGNHRPAGADASITRHAIHPLAGSEQFLWADFQGAYTSETVLDAESHGGKSTRLTAHLGLQSVMPLPPRISTSKYPSAKMWCNIEDSRPGLRVGITATQQTGMMQSDFQVPLYNTQLKIPPISSQQTLELSIDCERTHKMWTPYVYLMNTDNIFVKYELASAGRATKKMIIPRKTTSELSSVNDVSIKEVGIMAKAPWEFLKSYPDDDVPVEMLRIYNLSILLKDVKSNDDFEAIPIQSSHSPAAINIRGSERDTAEDDKHVRISWDLNELAMQGPNDGLHHPMSAITGAMSHFEVTIDGGYVDRVYGSEMVLPERFMHAWSANQELEVKIDCVRFGGMVYRGATVRLSKADAEWEVV